LAARRPQPRPTALTGEGPQRSRGFLYFEYEFNFKPQFPVDKALFARKQIRGRGQLQAIRIGDFTAVRYGITNANEPFRLYNVVTDPHEDHNLAGEAGYAALLARARALTAQVRRPEPSAHRPYDHVAAPATAVNCKTNGVIDYAVYQGDWPWVPDFDALQSVATGKSAGLDLGVLSVVNGAGASFKGYIHVPTDGSYVFSLQSDSGAQMWIDESHVIDDDFNHTGAEVSGAIRLKAGLHPFRIFYRHKSGAPKLALTYSGPQIEKQPVPLSVLSSACEK
jgi:hypothetical protein